MTEEQYTIKREGGKVFFVKQQPLTFKLIASLNELIAQELNYQLRIREKDKRHLVKAEYYALDDSCKTVRMYHRLIEGLNQQLKES